MNALKLKIRLVAMNFLEFAVWGAYLTSMGAYLAHNGLGTHIGWFYAVQGLVSLFMPAGCPDSACWASATSWPAASCAQRAGMACRRGMPWK